MQGIQSDALHCDELDKSEYNQIEIGGRNADLRRS